MAKWELKEKYERWWKGKFCRLAGSREEFKLVVNIDVIGPPSGYFCDAILHCSDGSRIKIIPSFYYRGEHGTYQPRKYHVETLEK